MELLRLYYAVNALIRCEDYPVVKTLLSCEDSVKLFGLYCAVWTL
jgi:hypothetical protein